MLGMPALKYDIPYILSREAALRDLVREPVRRARMDRAERIYRLDVWQNAPAPGEYRVTIPVGFVLIETMRALLAGRQPQISVPANTANVMEQELAQRVEKYLYGLTWQTGFRRLWWDAEWAACTLGEGFLKIAWNPAAAHDELPIIITAPDPRTVFGRMSIQRDRYVELVHTWTRRRSDIRAEWGDAIIKRAGWGPPEFATPEQQAKWWDAEVEYIEWWFEEYTEEEEPPKPKPPKLLAELIAESFIAGRMEEAEMEMTIAAEEEPKPEKPKKRRIRRVIHAVVVKDSSTGGQGIMLKKPVVMQGYERIPFFSWGGISTPYDRLSILYPLTSGDGEGKALGVLAAISTLASVDFSTAIAAPNSPLFVTDPDAEIDMDPGAVNRLRVGATALRVPPDATNPAVVRMFQQLRDVLYEVSVPQVLAGQVFNLSGQAISGLINGFTRKIAAMQQEREVALERLFSAALRLTKHYAPPEGWTAWGRNDNNRYVEETIKPDDIHDSFRVVVKLDASMPKDEIAHITMLLQLVREEIISVETAQTLIQPLIGLASDTPSEEYQRILRDKILRQGEIAKVLARALGREALADLVAAGVIDAETGMEAQRVLEDMGQESSRQGPGPARALRRRLVCHRA